MEEELKRILAGMADAGCEGAELEKAKLFIQTGDRAGLMHLLRKCRCSRMEELHISQRRVDCLDYLIRQTSKA